jgi:hypothetical protein
MSLQEKTFVERKWQVAGPYQATFDGSTIVLKDADAEVEASDWS